MGLGTVMQSAGAWNRAESEFNLLKNENQKRLRADSTLSRARTEEKDARSGEADRSIEKSMGAFYQKKSADEAVTAAGFGLISALVGATSSVVSGAGSGGLQGAVLAGLSSVFSVLGAFMAYIGAGQEAEMIGKQYGYISKDAAEDQKNTAVLDANPAL